MRNYCVVIVGLMLAGVLTAQTRQQGQMMEYDLMTKKKPLKAVEIQVLNAQSTVSDKNGAFLLEFRTLKPGDRVQVRSIEKEGYEIFNKEAVEQWNVSSGEGVFEIVMCRSDKFKALKDSYNRASSASYDRQYRQEVARVEKQLQEGQLQAEEYERKLQQISERYDRQLQTLDTYVDKFARLDLTRLSATEQQIVALVKEGRFDEAIELYEKQNLMGQITDEINDLREINEAQKKLAKKADEKQTSINRLHDAILRQANVLMLAGGQENMDKVEQLYEQLTTLLPDDTRARMTYIAYLLEQRRFDKAAVVVEATDTTNLDPWYREELYKYAGELYYQMGDDLRSRDYNYRAMNALNQVDDPSLEIQIEEEKIVLSSIIALNEIEMTHYEEGNNWLQHIDKALAKLEALEAPSLVWMKVAGYFGKSTAFFHMGMMSEALEYNLLVDSLMEEHKNDKNIYNDLTPYFVDLRLIHVCQNLGLIYIRPGETYNPEKAELYFKAVLQNATQLAENFPRGARPYIQSAHQNLGVLYYTQDTLRCLEHTRESLRLSRELYEDHSVTRQAYALALSNSGFLAADLGDYAFAAEILAEAAEVIAPLDLQISNNIEVAYFVAANTAYMYLKQGLFSEGLPTAERAVELGRLYSERFSFGWYSYATMTLLWRAEFARQLGDEEGARRFTAESQAILSAHGQ